MEGKCLITTSRAWMVSNGTLGSRPERASCKACKLTQDIHFMATLNILSFPSPGSVTSSSTCNNAKQQTKMILSIDGGSQKGQWIPLNSAMEQGRRQKARMKQQHTLGTASFYSSIFPKGYFRSLECLPAGIHLLCKATLEFGGTCINREVLVKIS